MSSDLYEVIALAARYLFAFLGVVIVLRSYFWLLSDRREKHRRLRRLPDAGNIGEMVVLSGSSELPEGTCIPVPWEGELGAVRSCDIVVPCNGVRKRHLRFFYQIGRGLQILPLSGCEATVDSVTLDCRSGERGTPMVHGSFLQVGSALLRLRVFAGLDSAAGFDKNSTFNTEPFPVEVNGNAAPGNGPQRYPDPAAGYNAPGYPGRMPGNDPAYDPYAAGDPMFIPQQARPEGMPPVQDENGAFSEQDEMNPGTEDPDSSASARKRRSARWEEDWSE